MSMKRFLTAASVLFAASLMLAHAADAPFKATCPVSGKAAAADKTAEYKGGTVYLCCGNCAEEFGKNQAKYSAKANMQLAETGQATQTKCPLSGGKLNPDATVDVSGVKVTFCCNNCKGKVAEAKGDAQIDMAFKDEAFAKAFEVKKK